MSASRTACLAVALAAALAGCGKSGRGTEAQTTTEQGPIRTVTPVAKQGAVSLATRNTTRLGGTTPAADAAAVARAVYPGLTVATRPQAAILVDQGDWPVALAAASLAGAPLSAPILFAEGSSVPSITEQTLAAMKPTGAPSLEGAHVVRLGTNASAGGAGGGEAVYPAGGGAGQNAAALAADIAQLLAKAAGRRPREVIVVPLEAPQALQMPAAGLAAESAAPILYVTREGVPGATRKEIEALGRPSLYVLAEAYAGPTAMSQLRALGAVHAITTGSGETAAPVDNAIAAARYTDGSFGWGVKEPGHGLVFANQARSLDAPAAALLSATGDYGPLLLLSSPDGVPAPLSAYLSDIQPAYTSAPQFQPVRGVYNHGWLIGDESAISTTTQAEIDSLLEISPRQKSPEEAAVTQSE